jgi:hypothetical protein
VSGEGGVGVGIGVGVGVGVEGGVMVKLDEILCVTFPFVPEVMIGNVPSTVTA